MRARLRWAIANKGVSAVGAGKRVGVLRWALANGGLRWALANEGASALGTRVELRRKSAPHTGGGSQHYTLAAEASTSRLPESRGALVAFAEFALRCAVADHDLCYRRGEAE